MAFGGHFSDRGPKINPFFETLLCFFCLVGRGRVLLEDPGDISAVMGYLPHPGYKGVPQGLNIPIGPQSKPLREPNLAPNLNPSGNQI